LTATAIASHRHPELDKVGEVMALHPARSAVIIGHTDVVGEARYNRMLSALRAAEVRDYLVDKFGVDPERIITEGRGEDEPIASNESYGGRVANRRIEVVLVN
jgi:OmpA-OmpF porin, OOP family